MALELDPTVLEKVEGTADGVEVPLTKAQRDENIFYKFESTDSSISDTQHYGVRREEIVADIPFGRSRRARIGVKNGDGELQSVSTDHGLIIQLEGTPAGIYGYVDGRFINEEETEEWENNTGMEAARATRWGFKVTKILKTNGPELRERNFRTEEQKKEAEQAELFTVIAEAFRQGMSNAAEKGEMAPDLNKVLESVDMNALQAELDRRKGGGKSKS